MPIPRFSLVVTLFLSSGLAGMPAAPSPAAFFEQHCTKCHGAEKQKGEVRLDTLGAPTAKGVNAATWQAVLEVLEAGDMPPKKEPRPDAAAVAAAVASIADALAKSADRAAPAQPHRV